MDLVLTETAKKSLEELYLLGIDQSDIMIIYGHYCNISNKWYIGYTHHKDPRKRWSADSGIGYMEKRNGKYTQPKIARAIEKYGWDSFDHFILDYCKRDDVDQFERNYISLKDSFKNGYNSTVGGEKLFGENNPCFGKKLSEERKNHLREIFSGENNPRYGKIPTNDTREKISQRLKEYYMTHKGINSGRIFSEEHRKKISISNTGRPRTEVQHNAIIQSNKTRKREPLSEEAKLRISVKKYGKASPVKRNVVQMDDDLNILNIFETTAAAGRYMSLYNGSQISACCRGKQQKSAGYIWKYIEDVDQTKLSNFKKDKIQ